MENNVDALQTDCLNCGTSIKGNFCNQCGQHVRDNTDRSMGRLFGEVLSNIFFFDNRFFISVWYLFRFPGRMAIEFLEGKRKKFISPITLFLFFNLIYFFVSPLTDFSLPLEDQMYDQPYSSWTIGLVDYKLQNEGLDVQDYSITYQNASDNISKAIMIINVPMIAFFVYLIAFKRRRFYFDTLIFSFHYFSLFLATWVLLDWVEKLIVFISGYNHPIVADLFYYMYLGIPLLYAMLSIKKFIRIRWYWAIPAGIGVMVAFTLANLLYRLIIFIATLGLT